MKFGGGAFMTSSTLPYLSSRVGEYLTIDECLKLIYKLLSDGWEQIAPPFEIGLDVLMIVVKQLGPLESMNWAAGIRGNKDLSRKLVKVLSNDMLWSYWFAKDFPDYIEEMGRHEVPAWIMLNVSKDVECDFRTQPWRRAYLWLHYFTMKLTKRVLKYGNKPLDGYNHETFVVRIKAPNLHELEITVNNVILGTVLRQFTQPSTNLYMFFELTRLKPVSRYKVFEEFWATRHSERTRRGKDPKDDDNLFKMFIWHCKSHRIAKNKPPKSYLPTPDEFLQKNTLLLPRDKGAMILQNQILPNI